MEKWLRAHPYLEEISRLQEGIKEILRSWKPPELPAPRWENHDDDLRRGIPLLICSSLDRTFTVHAGEALCHLVEGMSSVGLPEKFSRMCAQFRERLQQSPETAARLVESQLTGPEGLGDADPTERGVFRFFCWMALGTVLEPWREGFENWRQNIRWEHPYCPCCGAGPAMAQLTRTRGGRKRLLSCGCCGTRWDYQRLGCPFCGNDEHSQLAILELEDDETFRLDVCHGCQGFLKTYTREGEETFMLADWSTIHLDMLAIRQGFQRLAHSLYEL